MCKATPIIVTGIVSVIASLLLDPPVIADVQSAAYSSPTSFVYKLKHMPDFDQRRMTAPGIVGLTNNGEFYCVPTALVNIFAYAANHGFSDVNPGTAWWASSQKYNESGTTIMLAGLLMGTDPFSGTGFDGTTDGCNAWLDDTFLVSTHFSSDDSWSPKIEELAHAAINGHLVAFTYGRYPLLHAAGAPFQSNVVGDRDGGHRVTLVQANRFGDDIIIRVNDPADDPDDDEGDYLITQSPFGTRTWASAKGRIFEINPFYPFPLPFSTNKFMTALQFPVEVGQEVRLIDSATFVFPMFGFGWQPGINNNPPKIKFPKPKIFLGSSSASDQTIELAVGQVIVDATPSPEYDATLAIISQAGSPFTLRRIDHVTAEQVILASVPNATDLALGRKREMYVLSAEQLKCFNVDAREAEPFASIFPPGPCVSICVDDVRDEVVLLSPSQRKIFRYPERLPVGAAPTVTCIPAIVPLGPDGWMSINPLDGKLWFATPGSNAIFHVPDGSSCDAVVQQISLPQIFRPRSLSFDDRGHLFVMADAGLLELEPGPGNSWTLMANPYFGTVVPTTTRRFSVTRSRTNFDRDIHTGPGFYDIDPDELDDGSTVTIDCVADLNDDQLVNVDDLIRVINAWGPCEVCLADMNDDRVINVDELLMVINAWGPC